MHTAGRRASEPRPAQRIRMPFVWFAKRSPSNPQDLELRSTLALYLAKSGDKAAALAQIKDVDRASKKTPAVLLDSAVVHELCGERDIAFSTLSAALKAGYYSQRDRRMSRN